MTRLTPAEITALQQNFAGVKKDIQRLGNNLFARYLYGNPADMKFFPKFADVPIVELASNPEFNAQTLTVLEFLAQVVDNIGDGAKAKNLLRERAKTHKPRGIRIAQFERLLDLVPRFLEEEAGASGEVADAWRVLIASLMPALRDQYAK